MGLIIDGNHKIAVEIRSESFGICDGEDWVEFDNDHIDELIELLNQVKKMIEDD